MQPETHSYLPLLPKEELVSTIETLNQTLTSVSEAYEKLRQENEKLRCTNAQQAMTIKDLSLELADVKRLMYGTKSERFEPKSDDQQGKLFDDDEGGVEEPEPEPTIVTGKRRRPGKRKKPKRHPLPGHLRRDVTRMEPPGDTTGLQYIGMEVTEYYEYTPGSIHVVRIERPKYADPVDPSRGVEIATMPKRLIPKGNAGPGLLAHLAVSKYADHLPLYRIRQQFLRQGVKVSKATMGDWISKTASYLDPLADALQKEVLRSGYVQVDETTIQVQDSKKKRKTHCGYYWVYLAPKAKLVVMEYNARRARAGPVAFLEGYTGAMQTDGYVVYDVFDKRSEITTFGCMAHARRKFHDCQKAEPQKAGVVLAKMQQLYAIERRLRKENADPARRLQLRQQEARPVLEKLKTWLTSHQESSSQNRWNEAVGYMLNRWDKLVRYLDAGEVEIDNNLVENQMRAIAVGRKNYMFAGSHAAAQRAAVCYSLLASCKLNDVNPTAWLTDVLRRLPTHPVASIAELLPHRWQQAQQAIVNKAA